MSGFSVFLAGAAMGALGLVLGIVAAIRAPDQATLTAVGLCALIVLPVAGMAIGGRRFPPINDITTNTTSPPEFVQTAKMPENQGIEFSYPGESFARQQQAGYPELKALFVKLTPSETFLLMLAAAESNIQWKVKVVDGLTLSLEGYEESMLFHFRDDFVVQARTANGGTLVEMRSRSRDGRGDLGVNAARIARFLEAVSSKAIVKSTKPL